MVDIIGMETFWERIELLLKKQGFSQKELGEAVSVSGASITGWKNGSIPRADIALKIANYLNVSVEWLITGEEGEIPHEILNLAYEISALPEVYKNFIKADLAKYKSACVSLDEEKISNTS